MRRGVGLILILASLASVALIAFYFFKADYWLLPPKEKFLRSWAEDVHLLETSGKLPASWKQIREIQLKTDNSPAQDWIVGIVPPIKKDPKGFFRLDVFVIHWLEGTRYGSVIQYNLVDLRDNNTTWELGRTFKLGFVY